MPPQRWCTRAAPSRRSRTRTRDPLINCTEAARTHARTHASLFERPSILAFRPFRTVTPFLLCFSLPSFHSILVAPLRIRFVSDEIRTFCAGRRGRENFTAPLEARSPRPLNASSRSRVENSWRLSRWYRGDGCRDTIGFFPPNPPLLHAFHLSRTLETFPFPYRDNEYVTEIQWWNVATSETRALIPFD